MAPMTDAPACTARQGGEPVSQETRDMAASSIRRIAGPTILLGSGSYFDFEAPETSEITIEDVAYGLAFTCRFAGQCRQHSTGRRVFYSVAEHSVRMSRIVPPEHAYDALMHEMGEAVCGDMTSPLKSICLDYKAVEKRCDWAIRQRFQVPMRDPDLIKRADMIMLATERRDLMHWSGESWAWIKGVLPLAQTIEPWEPNVAAEAFLAAFRDLAPAAIKAAPGKGVVLGEADA